MNWSVGSGGMAQTYEITDGVRRAKAADIAGHDTIWAEVGNSSKEEKIPVRALLSPKKVIDVSSQRELARWDSIKRWMARQPDLFPPIHIAPGSNGTPIEEVSVVGERN